MSLNRLVIGTRRYSSWSMRGWLAVQLAGLDVAEIVIPIASGPTPEIARVTPHGLVPYLEHDGARIWESLAIAEYCAEQTPGLWPSDRVARAEARSIAAEMHAGFTALRQAMPMNLGRDDYVGLGRSPAVLRDVARIEAIWAHVRSAHGGGGPFLFGEDFGLADAMFAPVVTRFLTYRPDLSEESRKYCAAVRAHPLVAAWYDAASREPEAWRVEKYETLR